ncbi:MAG: GGDEF domain-containing protein [Lysobacter sp.]|nr:GGDEF domain-containing protein [Lysobacter sp.]
MRGSGQWVREYLGTLLVRPDEIMLAQGAGGELLVARIRALLSALILLLPLANAVTGAKVSETLIGLGAAVCTNIVAQIWLALAHQPRRHGWLPYATGTWDVTATTGVLVLLALGDRAAGLNSMVVWAFYLISIVITALRNDGRLTLYVTLLAIVEYGLLAWVVLATSGPEQLASVDYGIASVANQVERLVLILLMGVLTVALVQRMQRLIELSGRDGLTGLPNRLWLLQRMPAIFEEVRGEGGSLTLALLDLDRFRRINDEVGHRDGDRAIRHVATLLGETLATRERIVRIGGQEFVLLLHCPLGSAWERVDRLRRGIADRPFVPEFGADPQRITFSAGLAAWPQDGVDLSSLLHSADRRLRQAKRDGSNRVVARDA